MFALELDFNDGVSQREMILVRRPRATVGGREGSNVVVEDLAALDYDLRLVRGIGHSFTIQALNSSGEVIFDHPLSRTYTGGVNLNLGVLMLRVTPLDSDLVVREGEPAERAGVRVARVAAATPSPKFPAVVVDGSPPLAVSFSPETGALVGRGKQATVRLDLPSISSKHARIGYQNGSFWIEDLGSTNGTFINGHQISGRYDLDDGAPVLLGTDVCLRCVGSEEQVSPSVRNEFNIQSPPSSVGGDQRFPALVSVSEVARPARLVLTEGKTYSVGRDPQSDIWLGAPHVSRQHCTIELEGPTSVRVTDLSTNGTGHSDGIIRKNEVLVVTPGSPTVLDFGGSVTVAVLFSDSEEQEFAQAAGSPRTFSSLASGGAAAQGGNSQADISEVGGRIASEGGSSSPSSQLVHPHQRSFLSMVAESYRSTTPFERILLWFIAFAVVAFLVFLAFLLVKSRT